MVDKPRGGLLESPRASVHDQTVISAQQVSRNSLLNIPTAGSTPEERTPMTDTPRHLVVTVHGIRTYGNWQRELNDLLEDAEPGITAKNYQYGFFSSLAFLVPPLRWLVARRFRNFLVHEFETMPAGSRIDLVAHSFGTFLVASALPYIPKGSKVHTLIFAGSVLRPSFPWYKYQRA